MNFGDPWLGVNFRPLWNWKPMAGPGAGCATDLCPILSRLFPTSLVVASQEWCEGLSVGPDHSGTMTNPVDLTKAQLVGSEGLKSAHTALAVKACLLGGKTATLNAQ